MKTRILLAALTGMLLAAQGFCDDDEPLVGIVTWEPGLRRDATDYDKTDYWCAIAYSPSTGKYGATSEWSNRDNADRCARENCNAPDARLVVLCCNGWCALALGKTPGLWGVGWAPDQDTADRFALQSAREQVNDAKVVYSINAREMRTSGVIAYSTTTGRWGYSCGYGRADETRAVNACGAPDAKIVSEHKIGWMALAVSDDDKSAYGWGWAGNRADAENNALEQCRKLTQNAKIAVSFCTNGATH